MIGIFSKGIAEIPYLESFLQDEVVLSPHNVTGLSYLAGWGLKPSANKTIQKAKKFGLPYLSLEDGFIRSIGLGVEKSAPLSLIADPKGIYYNSARSSLLEDLLNDDSLFTAQLLSKAHEAIEFIRSKKVSKYNQAGEPFRNPFQNGHNILIVDQTMNDMSVDLGGAGPTHFLQMIEYAQKHYPDSNLLVKLHPDVIAGKKQGYLTEMGHIPKVHMITENVNPLNVIEQMNRIFVVTSQLGFEALLMGKPVNCFGVPFYSSWGLTEDIQRCDRRLAARSVIELFAAAYLLYPRYINPLTGSPGTIMDVLHYIDKQRSIDEVKSKAFIYNIPNWKRQLIRPFLKENYVEIKEVKKHMEIGRKSGNDLLIWGYTKLEHPEFSQLPVHRIEDGFYRSVGLGSNFHRPLSLVIDKRGLYFNPNVESDLEHLLNHHHFNDMDVEQARKINTFIIEHGLTKYNIEKRMKPKIKTNAKRVIFIPGQVENDMSILLGSPVVTKVEDLLKEVRNQNPEAFILFKPHPDVISHNRQGALNSQELYQLCDHIEMHASVLDCIEAADEVHTLTSQAGFDALLRRKRVFTYGGPFYAGWGLTEDRMTFPRRNRKLTIDELIAGALMHYPKYFNPRLGQLTDCYSALNLLVRMRAEQSRLASGLTHNSRLRILRKYKHLLTAVIRRDK